MQIEINNNKIILSRSENDSSLLPHVFHVGWKDVSKELALGLKITFQKADKIRLGKLKLKETVKKQLFDEIFEYRCSDIFKLIQEHLNKIEYKPSTIIVFGTTNQRETITKVAREILKIPVYLSPMEI